MKRTKKDKKKIFAAALAIFLAALMLLGSIAPFLYANEVKMDIEVSAEVGYSGVYKPGYPTLVKILVQNNGPAFKGEVQLKSIVRYGNDEKFAIHAKEVDIAQNTIQEIEIEFTMNHLISYPLTLEVLSGNKVLYSENINASAVDPELNMGLVLSDSPDNLRYLRNMTIGTDTAAISNRLLFTGAEGLPEKPYLLDIFSFIIINDFDILKLNEKQMKSLNGFISEGGVVMLGTGANYYKSVPNFSHTAFFDSPDMGIKTVTYKDRISEELYLALNSAVSDYTYASEEGYSIAQVIKENSGSLIVLSYDLSTEPAHKGEFYELTSEILTDHIYTPPGNDDYWNYLYTSKYYTLPDIGNSVITIIFVIAGLYILIIGPVLYYILKKKDKREYGFVIIPVFSILMTALIYIVSFNTPFKKPILNKMNFIYLDSESADTEYETSMGYLYYKAGDTNITLSDQRLSEINFNLQDYNYYYPSSYGEDYQFYRNGYKILEKDGLWKADLYDTESFETTIISYKGNAEYTGYLSTDYSETDDTIKGSIINNSPYDYEDLIIMYGAFAHNFGDLKGHSQVDFEIQKAYSYTKFTSADSYYDSLMSNYAYFEQGYQEREIKYYNMLEMENKLMNAGKINLDGGQLIVYAFNTDEMFNENIRAAGNKKPVVFNRNTISIVEDVPVSLTGEFTVDYGMIEYEYVFSQGEYYEYDKNRFQLELYTTNYAEVFYFFDEPDRIAEIQFSKPENYFNVTYQIYNYSEGQYENMKFTPYGSHIAGSYVNDDGEISIKMIPEQMGTVSIPQLRLKGGAADAGN